MCGRARCTLRGEDTAGACHRRDGRVRTVHMDRYRPSYNVSPGNALPVVYREDGSDADGVVLHCMKWGLIPSFTKKTEKPDHYKMFNARSESIYEKASFRRLIPKNRCLVAVEGFYEWKKDGPRKQPYYIHFEDGRPLVFAALYDSWKNSEGEIIYTFSILTTSSSSALKWLHDRMPVILGNKESTDTWLNGSSVAKFDNVLKPYEDPDLVWYPVTPAMGKSSFDGPECIKKIELKAEGSNPISKFFSTKRVKREEESELEVKRVKREEEESDLEVKGSCAESTKTDASKSLEKEPNQQENKSISSLTEGGLESKSTTISSKEGTAKCQMKLEDGGLKGDSEPVKDATAKLCSTPARKKGNLKRGNDNNQPTLFSYFGKN